MNPDLTNEEGAALLKELNGLIDGDRYFLSERVKTLKAIRAKIRPEPGREPLPPPKKRYAPPRASAARDGAEGSETSRYQRALIFPHLSSQHPTMLGLW
jgi:hypothetical protein